MPHSLPINARRLVPVVLLALTFVATEASAQDVSGWSIGTRGIGPIRFGMTIGEAQDASGLRIRLENYGDFASGCGYGVVSGRNSFLSFMIGTGHRIMSVTVDGWNEAGSAIVARGKPRTRSGVGVGTTVADVRRTYPHRLRTSEDLYEGTPILTFVPRDREDADYRVVFRTDGSQVTGVSAGMRGWADSAEGCS